jgi:hypothetical protein
LLIVSPNIEELYMSIVFRTDSDNYVHQVWAQEQANSCAVASIWMARGQARQMTFAEEEWALAWQIYGRVVQGMQLVARPPAPMSLNPAAFQPNQGTFQNMFARFGTYMDQVAQALRNEGLSTVKTAFTQGTMTVNPALLSDTTPAIVLLGWYNGANRNGGHFIVASRVVGSGNIVYLDPWEGQLRELGPGPNYPGGGRFEQVCYVSVPL